MTDQPLLVDTPRDPAESYLRLQQASGMADLSGRTRLALTGDDRQSFLHNLCTNDVNRLASGQGCEAFVTNVQGKCLGHVVVLHDEDQTLIGTTPEQADVLLPHFDRYLITEDVQLADLGPSTCELLLAGPETPRILASMLAGSAPSQPFEHARMQLSGIECRIASVDWLTVPACLIIANRMDGPDLVAALQTGGILASDAEAFHRMRIESCYPWFGWDVTDANLPQEVDRNDQAISFTKGCYLGQETVARLDALGHVNKLLVKLQCADTAVPERGTDVTVEGQVIGHITSAAASPTGDETLGLAYVRCQHAQPGTEVMLDTGTGRVLNSH